MASHLPDVDRVSTSRPGVARGVVLAVPRTRRWCTPGEYSQYGGGGEAWCSPTSTAMVLGYYGGCRRVQYTWVRHVYRPRGWTTPRG